MKRSAADVLIELLGKVPDAATLEILLDPAHLAVLVRERLGDDGVREAKDGRSSPGELLLAVLEREPDTAVLLASLGNPTPKPKKPPVARTAGAAAPPGARPIRRLVVGLLFALPSAWYLFIRLDVIHVPGLIKYFPQAYGLLAALLLTGVYFVALGIAGLYREQKQKKAGVGG